MLLPCIITADVNTIMFVLADVIANYVLLYLWKML